MCCQTIFTHLFFVDFQAYAYKKDWSLVLVLVLCRYHHPFFFFYLFLTIIYLKGWVRKLFAFLTLNNLFNLEILFLKEQVYQMKEKM